MPSLGSDEKHVRFNDTPEVRTYKPDPAENKAEIITPGPTQAQWDAQRAKPLPTPPGPESKSPDPAAAPPPGTPQATAVQLDHEAKHAAPGTPGPTPPSATAPRAPAAAPAREADHAADAKAPGSEPFKDMPRDPNKLGAWLKENADKLPADERAMLDKALAGGQQIHAQGPPIQVDMGDQPASKPGFFDRVKDRFNSFASAVKDKVNSALGRDSSSSPPATEGPNALSQHIESLKNNPGNLSEKEQQLMAKVVSQDGPGQSSPGGGPAATPPRDPAQYAQWLQKNPQALSPKEQALANAVTNQPDGPGAPSAQPPGTAPADQKTPAQPHLMTNQEAHQYAKHVADEHHRGDDHQLQRTPPGVGR